jgi:L-asparaginase
MTRVPLPRVTVLATGGTIAGAAASAVGTGYRSGEVGIDVLLDAVPGVRSIADVVGEQITQAGSQDADDALWLRLAARIAEVFELDQADGVVITHGTDTAEETGYFLHLVVKTARPVVLTGAMRPATALSADGPLNLFNAVAVAAHPEVQGHGVMLVINDDIHSAREVTKTSTTDVQTFISTGPGLLGTATFGRVRLFRNPRRRHTVFSALSVKDLTALPRVDILYAWAGMPADLVESSVTRGARGIVIAGVGNGNLPRPVMKALVEVAGTGTTVVRSSRVISGEVARNVEVDDDACGFIASDQLNPQKSRILLQLCLANGMDRAGMQDAFYRY